MNDVVAYGGIITATSFAATTRMLNFFSAFASEMHDRSESEFDTWFKTFCILTRSQTLVSD